MKSKKELEKQPEVDTTTQPTSEPYSRFNEPVNEKPGLGQRVTVTDPSLLNRPIEEVRFTPPAVDKEVHPLAGQQNNKTEASKQQPGNTAQKPGPLQDPLLQDLPPSQKQTAAEQAAGFLLNRYEDLHKLANKKIQISERKVLRYVREGKLDLRALVPYDYENWMTIGEFLKEYNNELSQLFFVDPQWRAEIEPPLTRILVKRGIGMSDEMLVGAMLVQDLTLKTSLAFEAFSKTSSIMQFAVEQTARMKGVVQMPPRPRPTSTEPPAGPAPVVDMPPPPPPSPSQQHGEEGNNIPLFISGPVRQQLYDLGYSKADVDAMAPKHAQQIIASMETKPSSIPVQDQVLGEHAGMQGHPMSDAVVRQQLPQWGPNAEKLNQRKGPGRRPGSTNKKSAKKSTPKKKRA